MAGNDDPEADTEWNAVLREKGILGPKKEVEITEAEIEAMMDKAIEDKYGPRRMEDVEDLDELDELFQDDGKTDDRVLE